MTRFLNRVPPPDGAATDGQLLDAYLSTREGGLFELLVRRHGPMVLGVCRRVAGHEQDAEDAFQATFLVLARKAASVWPRERVADWLYGVAYRAALKARSAAARRRARERQVAELPEPAAPPENTPGDLGPVLDEELGRLPAKYRAAIVLCDLGGRTRKEAARELGWPEGTVAGRLDRARALLADRLGRRGVTAPAAALAVALSGAAARTAPPHSLLAATLRAVPLAAAGEATAGVVSPGAAAMTDEVLRAMLATKLKIVAAVLVAAGLAGAGVVGAVYGARPGDDPPPAEQPPPRPAKAAPPGADPARPAAARPAEPKTHEEILKDWIYPGSEGPRYDRNAAKRYDYPAKAPIGKVLAFYDELLRKTYDVPEKLKPKLEPGHNGWTRAKAAEYSWVFENTPSGSRDVLDDMPAAVLTLRVPADREGWTVFIRRVNAGNTRVILVYDPPPEPR